MNVSAINRVSYTYKLAEPLEKISLTSRIIELFRTVIGSCVWHLLGKLDLDPNKKNQIFRDKKQFLSCENAKGLRIELKNSSGEITHELDGIAIGESKAGAPKYTVVFFGLRDHYESHIQSMKRLAEDTGTIVVSFNYRGTCESTGSPNGIKDYIEDGKAVIDYLSQHEKVDPKNILIYGHSLGGGVAAKVKEALKHPGPIISESSFSHFKKAVEDKKGAFTAWVIKKAGWNINSVKALKDVEEKHLGIIANPRDFVINYKNVSLYSALKENKPECRAIIVGTESISEDEKAIKNAGLTRYLRNPHLMIIDQLSLDKIKKPEKLENDSFASLIEKLNKQYAEEDQKAYEEMVDMIKSMLSIELENH